MNRFFLFFLVVASACLASHCLADENTDPAVSAAKQWLALVDSKQYKKSWQEAAPFFKEKITEQQWETMVAPVRNPFGEAKSRVLLGAQYTKTLPGAPDGEYVVIQFKTEFADKAGAVETITPMKSDGTWRVSGYYIK